MDDIYVQKQQEIAKTLHEPRETNPIIPNTSNEEEEDIEDTRNEEGEESENNTIEESELQATRR
jgi:hypothetical protein